MADVRTWFSFVEQHNYNEVRATQRKYAGARNDDGCTALMLAVKNNDLTMVEILSETESGLVNKRDETALFLACARNYDDIASVLIPKEQHLRQSSTGYTPLIVAAANGSTKVIPLLTPHFGNETDKQGYTALDYATYNNYPLCVDLLTKSEKFSVPDLERALKIAEECGHVQLHTKLTAHLMHKVKTLGDRATLAATGSKSPFTSPGMKQPTTAVNRFSGISPSQHTDKLGKVGSPSSALRAPKKSSPITPGDKGLHSFGRATSTLKEANKMALSDPQIGSTIPPLSDLGEIFQRNLAQRNKSVRSAHSVSKDTTMTSSMHDRPGGMIAEYNDAEMQIIHKMAKMRTDRDDEDSGVISMHQNPEALKHIKPRAQSNRVIPRPTYLLSPENDNTERQPQGPRSDALASNHMSHASTIPGTGLQSCDIHQPEIDLIPEEGDQTDNLIPPVIMDSYQNELNSIQRSSATGTGSVGRSTSVIGLPLSPTANIDTASTLKKISKMSATELRVACVEMLECIEGKERLLNKFLEAPITVAETSLKPRPTAGDVTESHQYAELLSSCDKYRSQAIDLQTKLDTVADVILTRSSQVYDILYQIVRAISINGSASQWISNTVDAQQKAIEGISHVADLCNKIWSTHSAMLEDIKSADSVLVREANRLLRKDSLTSDILLPTLNDIVPFSTPTPISISVPPPETVDIEVQVGVHCSDATTQVDILASSSINPYETIDRLASAVGFPSPSNHHSPAQIKQLKEDTTIPNTPDSNKHHHDEHAIRDKVHEKNNADKEKHSHRDSSGTASAPKETPESSTVKPRDVVKPTKLKLDENGNSTVMRAIKKIIKLDPYKVGEDGKSTSSRAHPLTEEEQAKLIKLFDEVKKDIKKQAGHENNDGYTALMMAASGNNIELIKILLPYEAGIRVLDDKDFIDNTATKISLLNGNIEAASLLLGPEGFEIQPPDTSGGRKTELMDAAEQGDVVSVYLYAPFQATLVDSEGKTALMYAAGAGKLKVFQYLKAELKMATPSGITAMMLAGAHGHHDCCKYLLEFERGMTDKHKMTALMHAASQGHRTCVEALIKEVGAKTKEGMNALMYATQAGSKPCVEYILRKYPKEKAITTTEKSKYGAGCTPADVAVKAGHPELVALLG